MDVNPRVEEVPYAEYQAEIHAIRDRVFIEEQGVPADIERDERDPHCIHVLAFVDGQAVATGRLDAGRGGKIGRVAVLPSLRGTGLGAAVMRALHAAARQRGLAEVRLHAQQHAAAFYQQLGYRAEGAPFDEAGIPHLAMRCML